MPECFSIQITETFFFFLSYSQSKKSEMRKVRRARDGRRTASIERAQKNLSISKLYLSKGNKKYI